MPSTSNTRLLRYLYPDGRVQAILPLHVVDENSERLIGWMAPGSEISYWALPDGSDPRSVRLESRFQGRLGTAPRRWKGSPVLRVIPFDECWQVLHFWDPATGGFLGWYVNLESSKRVNSTAVDTVDWHLDLLISPTLEVTWKDEDEAAAACGTQYLRRHDLETARTVGEAIADDVAGFLEVVGDWRAFTPPSSWGPLALPPAEGAQPAQQ